MKAKKSQTAPAPAIKPAATYQRAVDHKRDTRHTVIEGTRTACRKPRDLLTGPGGYPIPA